MGEGLEELIEVFFDWTVIPTIIGLVLLSTFGVGVFSNRFKKTMLVFTLIVFGLMIYLGLDRHEWGEVLFNGQLL